MLENYQEYEAVKDKLAIKLVGTELNREMLSKTPNRALEDMSIVCYCVYEDSEYGSLTFTVNRDLVDLWHISEERLFMDAMENGERMLPVAFDGISNILGCDGPWEDKMFVLSNNKNWYGASAILYPGKLKEIAEMFGKNLFILPSSIHEMILIPEEGGEDVHNLQDMVCEINQTILKADEILTNSVYYYDRAYEMFMKVRF